MPQYEVISIRNVPADENLIADLVPIIDETREIISDLGLRRTRVFLVNEIWEDSSPKGSGEPSLVRFGELTPSPRIRAASPRREHAPGGTKDQGGWTLDRISRKYSRETLLGRSVHNDDPAPYSRFSYALLDQGQDQAQLATVTGSPVLESFGSRVRLVATNQWILLPVED